MNTIKIYLTESGRIADLQKDFPLYQGQFQNKLLNVFVPTSILAPMFTSSGAVSADYVASTSTKIGMTYTARDGSIKTSKNYYMRYLKTLMYKGVEYALYERKLPKEFTFYAGQGENSPVLIINVVNIEQQSGDTPPLVLSVITSQTCHLDVMQSTFLDRDELDEPSELENLNAQVQALNALMPKKQDKEDENIALEQAPAEKTVVGAINELGGLVKTAQSSADTAQQTAETAQTTADNAIGIAEQAQTTANNALQTANEAKTTAQTAETNANSALDTANAANATAGEAKAIAQGSQRAIGFATLKAAITALNGYSNTQLKVGDNVYIVETGVPDLWVAAVEQNSVAYNYTTNDAFNDDLVENTLVQVGYYKFAYLESDGKPCTVAWQNMTVAASDWVASTEFADFPYEAKIILTDFVNFSSIPQVVFGLTEATSGNYAPICKAGDKGVYIYSKVNTAITLPTVVTFAPNVHGASMQGGGYTNKGKWVASTTYAIDDLVYTDNGQYVCIEGITSTTSPEQDTTHWQATFVATGKTKNGLKFSGQNTDGTNVQKTFDGSTTVEMAFDEQTMTAKEVNGVLKVGAKGTVPEALPAIGAKITGNLPTSGWSEIIVQNLLTKDIPVKKAVTLTETNKVYSQTIDAKYFGVLQGWKIGLLNLSGGNPDVYDAVTAMVTVGNEEYTQISYKASTGFKYNIYLDKQGNIFYADHGSGGDSVYFTELSNSTVTSQTYTISDTAIKTNSTVTMYLNSADEVRAISKTDGSVVVEMDAVPTSAIPYTLQVVETSAEGAFEIVNSYLPTIPETPTALPQTASALKSGNLPTNGWGSDDALWTGSVTTPYSPPSASNPNMGYIPYTFDTTDKMLSFFGSYKNWSVTVDGKIYTANSFGKDSDYPSDAVKIAIGYGYELYIRIFKTGAAVCWYNNKAGTITEVSNTKLAKPIYTISDTSITANSDILMELTDDGGVKSYSMEAGKMTVIRDTVPTSPIPYTYKVKQTNASGQFTVLNHFAGVTSVNGQTGAVTIAVPTKTSELTNDSGYVSSIPIVQNVVCNGVDSAATLDTTITCEVGDLILAQIIVRSALTLPTGWTLLRTIPTVETSTNQTLSFAYKRATSTSETLTVTQATAGRIYTNLVRLSNATSISYIQSCEKTGTGIKSISSTKPVTPNMVIWGAASATWNTSSPYGNWTYSPSTLDYYSLPQSTKQPRLGTFVDSNGAGERTFTTPVDSSTSMMCGAVEIVGDEVARKGDIPSTTTLYEDSTGAATVTLSETINNGDIVRIKTNNGNVDHYYIGVAWNRAITVTESLMVTDASDVTVGTAINIDSLRFNIQDTSLILFHYFNTNITTVGAVTITNEKANVVIRKVERIHT